MGAHKSATELIASEELLTDESVGLDDYLVGEVGARLGAARTLTLPTEIPPARTRTLAGRTGQPWSRQWFHH